jgi:endonuclease/exonuclease/phosphatase family metal-dependent hydrolase
MFMFNKREVWHFVGQFFFPVLLLGGLATLSLLQTGAQAAAADEPEALEIRVLCYNIHHGRGTDDQIDLNRIARVIELAKPDLVALQEVDNRTERTDRVDQTAELAGLTGYHGKFVKQIDYEGGEYGQAILSRYPISDVQSHWLPGVPDRDRRIVGVVQLSIGGQELSFATTHLHHINESFRVAQAQELNRLFSDSTRPVILAGDFNAEPASPPLVQLAQVWTVAQLEDELKTFPAVSPTKQLDYVLFCPKAAFEIVSAEVMDEPLASDHRPVLVVLRRPVTGFSVD